MSDIEPLTPEKFQHLRWKTPNNFAFAARDSFCPLAANELHLAVMGLPIAFIPIEDTFMLVALTGLRPNDNLLVDSSGNWVSRYIPLTYRYYPLLVVKHPENPDKYTLCIQTKYLSEHEKSDGELFFTDSGEPSNVLLQVSDELGRHTKGIQSSAKLSAKLDEFNLLKPWEIEYTCDGATRKVEGIYCIDENELYALAPQKLAELRDSGGLTIAFCQLLSMSHIAFLRQQIVQPQKPDPDSIDELIFDTGQSINFDNL